jgi:hypothetical protein
MRGVPQGSILGPLLFLIYINYLPYGVSHEAKPIVYADDTSILLNGKSTEELKTKVNSVFNYVIDWSSVNGLVLNLEKTNIAKFIPNQNEPFQFIYQNKVITESNNIKFLGLEVDMSMNWKNHVHKILSKLSSARYIIRAVYLYSSCDHSQSGVLCLLLCCNRVWYHILQEFVILRK